MRNKQPSIVVMTVLTGLLMAGCQTTLNNSQKGAAIGAVAGAVIGKGTGDHDKSRYLWGAVAGALAGGAIGAYMDRQEEEFRQELAGSGVQIYREGDNLRLLLPGNITFATGSAAIQPNFHVVLDDVAKVLAKYDKTTLLIEGHTDSVGDAMANQQLSLQRAGSVRNYLGSHNVDTRRLTVEGFGESMPISDNTTAQGRQANRRVELRIIPNT